MKKAAPNWAAPKGLPQGRIPSSKISLVHSKACMPTNVAPSAAVHSNRMKVIFLLRSEEHTSELQSQSNLVCRLLLEKKKNKLAYADLNFTHNRPTAPRSRAQHLRHAS